MTKNILFSLLCMISFGLSGQVVNEHISNSNIYNFLDELANEQIIELNSAIKPYSRIMICEKLEEVKRRVGENEKGRKGETVIGRNGKVGLLNKRQLKELDFYLKAYALEGKAPLNFSAKTNLLKKSKGFATALNPPGLFYKENQFSFTLKPILGYEYSTNKNGAVTHSWGGLDFIANLGKNLGFYTSLRDNNVSKILIDPEYLVQTMGVPFKNFGTEGIDYSEARGGITYSWKWGSVGLIKDHIEWGNNYHGSNIFSGRTPSFAMIKLNLKPVKWFEFNYFHGWLVSSIVDSSRSYMDGNSFRAVFYPKYIAANMFTFKPWKHFYFSVGNSIVYSDINIQAAYLIPFLFYKSVDHTLNATYQYGDAGQNSQMFMDISSRQIKHLHLYASVFVDELSLRHMFDPSMQSNLISAKFGFQLSDFPFQNILFGIEYTRTNPLAYQQYISTSTFASNNYNLGFYLKDNSDVYNINLIYKPIRGLHLSLLYSLARHGEAYDYKTTSNRGLKFMEDVLWENQTFLIKAKYEIVNNTYVYLNYQYSNITGNQEYIERYTPEYYWGETGTFTVGMNLGF